MLFGSSWASTKASHQSAVGPTIDVLRTEPSLCWCIEPLVASSRFFSTNHPHPLVRQSERILEAWFTGILRVHHTAGVVVLVDVVELAACWS
jgi:hypothetical protein